ncbi:hypothetical protein OROMI_032497 [Orobanche minor]
MHHLAQTHKGVAPCPSVPPEVKNEILQSLQVSQVSKLKRSELLREIGEGPRGESKDSSYFESGEGSSQGNVSNINQGTLDNFVKSAPRQTTINSAYKKELLNDVKRRVGRFIFSAALPFNVPPTMHELRTWVLKAEVDDINIIYEDHKKAWKTYGCTIMSDGWTDQKQRALMNFLVNSPAGTFFIKSVDVSDSIKNGELIFKYLDEVIDEVGENNVIQIITDNASNCKNAGKRIMEARKSLWWTPCAAHCIDLMLEDIAKLKIFEEAIENAKKVVKFIYGHGTILALMRKHTNDKELLRPAVTRFATAILTLQSMYKQKRALEVMFSSDEWVTSAQAKKTEGKVAKRIVVNDPNFWPYVAFCVKSVVPLVSVLREVDSEERPAMDARWTPQLHHPLHAAGYYLNPQLRYEVGFSNCSEVKEGLYACMDRMLSNDDRLAADIQLDNYDNAQGDFGCPMAIRSRKLRSPVNGGNALEVRHRNLLALLFESLALRVVLRDVKEIGALLNTYKKKNRLEHKRLNALVYVKYNLRLRERSIKRRNKIDPIVVDEIDSDDEWITEKEDPVLPEKPSWLENDDLFSGDPIVSVPSCPFDSLIDIDKRVEVEVVDGDNGDDDTLPPSPSPPRIPQKRITESSSGSKCKKRRMEFIDEDVELEDHAGINPRNFDSGKSATIETIDDDTYAIRYAICATRCRYQNTIARAIAFENTDSDTQISQSSLIKEVGFPNRVRFQLPGEAELAEEADALLEGLGPRFTDWWGYGPLPVDADLLPSVVPAYKRPFRLLPYGVKPKLTNDEMTTLKRLGWPLPCHFALVRSWRNSKHQGLAASIVKLWEKCEIAKIAIKRGALNTNSELMAEELKWLTGGTLRNLRSRSEKRKLRFSRISMERTSTKLSIALKTKAKAEKLLAELDKAEISQPPETDKEGITEEEKYMLTKVGLRMKPFLLLGWRGVLMELRSFEEVHGIARTLEAESGGILVAVEQVSKGYAIISLKLHVLKLSRNIDELKLKMAKDKDTSHMQLTQDLGHGFVDHQEAIENHHNDDKISHGDPGSDHQSYPDYPVNEWSKTRENPETDAISKAPEDPIDISKGSVHIAQKPLPVDFCSESLVKGNKAEAEKHQSRR